MENTPFKNGSKEEFLKIMNDAVEKFTSNKICQKLENGTLTMKDYQDVLRMIFHQTFEGPATFALAGGMVDPKFHEARDYLLHHSDEEKNHWTWVIGDLKNTGDTRPDPRTEFPQLACQAYIAFNNYIGLKAPLARLGIAAVLESIGAHFGKKYATKLCKHLSLKPDQAVFFFGHGDTDVGHTADIMEVISRCDLTPRDWGWFCHAAKTAGELYRRMYDEATL